MLQDLLHERERLMVELRLMDRLGAKGEFAKVAREEVVKQISAVNRVFGEHPVGYDKKLAEWDAALESGQLPDFQAARGVR